MTAPFTFNTTRSVRFGAGVLGELPALALPLTGPRVLIVTDPGMMGTGIVDLALCLLRDAGL